MYGNWADCPNANLVKMYKILKDFTLCEVFFVWQVSLSMRAMKSCRKRKKKEVKYLKTEIAETTIGIDICEAGGDN